MWLPLAWPLVGTWPATQACALVGNWTGNFSVGRPVLNPLSHTSRGSFNPFKNLTSWTLLSPLLNIRNSGIEGLCALCKVTWLMTNKAWIWTRSSSVRAPSLNHCIVINVLYVKTWSHFYDHLNFFDSVNPHRGATHCGDPNIKTSWNIDGVHEKGELFPYILKVNLLI